MTGGMGAPAVPTFRYATHAVLGLAMMAAVTLARPATARAGLSTFQYQLGQQDFAGDNTPIYDSQIRAAGAGEAYPFNGTVFGDDRTAKLGSLQYTHTFDAATILRQSDGMRSASLTLGVIDIDSPPGSKPTLGVWFNGVRQPVDALFTGISAPGIPSSAEVVTVPVPLHLLGDGSLNVRLTALRAAPGFRGNSIAVDFSKLSIEADLPDAPDGDGGNRAPGIVPWGNGGGGPDKPPTAVPLLRSDLAGITAVTTLALGGLLARAARRRRSLVP
jgi:hypothetical protein